MESFHRLEEIFAKFPGIGPRQARRFVHHLLNKSPSAIREFTDLVQEVKKSASECGSCHRFFIQDHNARSQNICPLCSDHSRDSSLLMIVARDSDFESVERSGVYRGLYFILGGTVPILDRDPEKRIRLKMMLSRIAEAPHLKEIILSLNATPEGENTSDIVKKAILNLGKPIRITVLGRGISTGAELEYMDGETIKNALKNRQ